MSEDTLTPTKDVERDQPSYSIDRFRTTVQAAHLNFLIGAGTSAAFFEVLGDVENVLTEVAAADAKPLAKQVVRASLQAYFFEGVIEPNLKLLHGSEGANEFLKSYANFGRALNRLLIARRSTLLGKKINLFTTNVDLAFEVSFERLGLELIDGFAGKLKPVYDPGAFGAIRYRTGVRYEHRAEVPTFDLFKLHGSVGWRLTDDPGVSSGIEFDVHLSDARTIRAALDAMKPQLLTVERDEMDASALLERAAKVKKLPVGLEAFTDAYERLVIVNPEKQKFATTVMTETYYELIRRFANELERENSVLFVHGFSFRDEHLRKIVVRAARTNPTLQVDVFCYSPGARDDLLDLITDDQVPNSNIAFIAPQADENLFTLDEIVDRYFGAIGSSVSAKQDLQFEALFKPKNAPRDDENSGAE